MTLKTMVLTGLITLGFVGSVHATSTGSAYFFGDSLTDCCSYGRTTNGSNWADFLAPLIGKTYTATKQSNYAVGGALSGNALPQDFLQQVARFTHSGTTVSPNDIVGIWIGTNDVWTSSFAASDLYLGQGAQGPIGRQPNPAVLASYIVGNIQSGIDQLAADGFKNVVLLSTYDLGQAGLEPNPAAAALATRYSTALTAAESNLQTPGVNTYFVDVQSLLKQAQETPATYGFQHIRGSDNCAATNCSAQPLSVQDSYIFQDNIHLTSAFNQLVAIEAASIINVAAEAQAAVPEPASAAVLMVGFAVSGLARRRRQSSSAPKG